MRKLRQSRLGISSDGFLCILPRDSDSPVFAVPGGPNLTKLIPDELLTLVFDHLPPRYSERYLWTNRHASALSVLLVCKRWHRCYAPFFYRKLNIDKKIRSIKLSKTLEHQPELCDHVREVEVTVNKRKPDIDFLTNILQRCSKIRTLSLHGDWSEDMQPLLETIARLEYIDTLSFTSSTAGPSVYAILRQLERSTLKHLRLERFGVGRAEQLEAPWSRNSTVFTAQQAEQLLPRTRHRSGSVSSLTICDPAAPAEVIRLIMNWPAALVSFTSCHLCHSPWALEYTSTIIQRILYTQCESLRHVSIGIIPDVSTDPTSIPDFTTLQYLETLQLSGYNLFAEEGSTALRKLSAPCLSHLIVSFDTEDQHSTHYSDFADNNLSWFKNFAALASKCSTLALKTIYIDFRPDSYPFDIDEGACWPWVYLDEAAAALSKAGVTLTYGQPVWSADEWEEHKLRAKIRRAHCRGEHAQRRNGEHTNSLPGTSIFCDDCEWARD